MFSNFDTNSDHLVELPELLEIERQGHLTQLEPVGCHLSLIVSRADKNTDGLVNRDEFAAVFGNFSSSLLPIFLSFFLLTQELFISGITVQSNNQPRPASHHHHYAFLNTQYQLVCNLPQSSDKSKVIWYRYSQLLTDEKPKLKYQVVMKMNPNFQIAIKG